MQSKKCPRCRKIKNMEDFPVRNRAKSGRASFCRICCYFLTKDWTERNPQANLKKALKYQKWHKRAGLCILCPNKAGSTIYCEKHRASVAVQKHLKKRAKY